MNKTLLGLGLAIAVAAPTIPTASAVPAIWEANFGSSIVSGDDTSTSFSFGFTFDFLGTSYTGGSAFTNGFISLGGSGPDGLDASVSSFLGGAARIAPAWYDQVTTIFLNTSVSGRAVLTWQGPEFSNTTVNTYQVQLFDTGDIIFAYDVLTPLEDPGGHRHTAITGLTSGGGAADPGETNFSDDLPLSVGNSVYEFFDRGPNGASGGTPDTFDLAGTNICFDAVGSTGFNVNSCTVGVPEPASMALLGIALAGFGAGGLRRRRG